ncbi:hypothetical protein F-liban_174 [Faustovirus]|nr:hypothetical protein F-liban_174 [Faustovirus]
MNFMYKLYELNMDLVLVDDVIRLIFSKIKIGLNRCALATTCRHLMAIWCSVRKSYGNNKPSSRSHERMFIRFMTSDKVSIEYILHYNKRYNVITDRASDIMFNAIITFTGRVPSNEITDGLDRLFDTFPYLKIPTRCLSIVVFLLAHKRVDKSAIRCYLEVMVENITFVKSTPMDHLKTVSVKRFYSDAKRVLSRYHWWDHIEIFGKTPLRTIHKVLQDPYSVLVKLVGDTNENITWTIQRSCKFQYDANWNITPYATT